VKITHFLLEIMGENSPGGLVAFLAGLALGLDFRDLQVLFQGNKILFCTKQ
jgi:hypothetical protein